MLDFAQESIAECWNELMVLASQHAAGTTSYRRHEPFHPLLSRYKQYEDLGMYKLITARDNGLLAGYFGLYVTTSMHSQLPILQEDTFFLAPPYRKGRNAVRFIQFVEARAKDWGVHEILFSCEMENAAAKALLKYLDYEPTILLHSKRLVPLPHPTHQDLTDPHLAMELSDVRT